MARKSMGGDIAVQQAVNPVILTTALDDITSDGIDLQNFESCEIVVCFGESADGLAAGVNVNVEVEHSDDDSTYADVATTDLLLTQTGGGYLAAKTGGAFVLADAATDDDRKYRCSYIGPKQYVRVILNRTGAHTTGIPVAVIFILGHPKVAPVTDATDAGT